MSAKAELQRRRLQAKLLLKAVSPKAPVSSLVSPNAVAKSKEAERELLEEEKAEKPIVTPSPKGSKKKKRHALAAANVAPAPSVTTPNRNEEANEFLLPHRWKKLVAFENGRARESAERYAEREKEFAAKRDKKVAQDAAFFEEISTTAARIPEHRFGTLLTKVNALSFNPMDVGIDVGLGQTKEQYIAQERPKIPTFIKLLENMVPQVFEFGTESNSAMEMNQIVCESINKEILFLHVKNYILPLILFYINSREIEVQTLPVVEIRKEAVVIDFGKGPNYLHLTIHTNPELCGKGTLGAFHARSDDGTKLRRYRIDKMGFEEIYRQGLTTDEEIRLMNYTMTLIRKLWRTPAGGGYRTRKIKRMGDF